MSKTPPGGGAGPRRGPMEGKPIRVGSWNCSYWTSSRLLSLQPLDLALCALQETKLADLPLENARGALKRLGYTLHHGQAAAVHRAGFLGDKAGVGFLASPGVAVSPLLPRGPAWRRLHAMARLHGITVAPRAGLPRGLHLFTVYAPLQNDAQRTAFNSEFMALIASLDMQIPTIFMGDFNGTVQPNRDYSSGAGPVCPLLTRLLGPGGPLLDLQLVVSPAAFGFTFRRPHLQSVPHSRCDLALGNRAVLGLVARVFVEPGVMDGGHSPVVVELREHSAWGVDWQRPRRQLPAVLATLSPKEDFQALLDTWSNSAEVQRFLRPLPDEKVQGVSTLMEHALQHLVALAGGWELRSSSRRSAFDSDEARRLRRVIVCLGRCSSLLRRVAGTGHLPYQVIRLLRDLDRLGLRAPATPFHANLSSWVDAQLKQQHQAFGQEARTMRADRVRRWKDRLPTLWTTQPGRLYSWLKPDSPAWGSLPILAASGGQCTTVQEVDVQVQDYWVRQVWLMHAAVEGEERWRTFCASSLHPCLLVADGALDR